MTNVANELPLHLDIPPLRLDPGGVVRVGKWRISLDLIVEQYEKGMAPEDIVQLMIPCPLPMSIWLSVITCVTRRRFGAI